MSMESEKPVRVLEVTGINRRSILEKLAKKIEPSTKELVEAGKLPKHSRFIRMVKQAKDIKEIPLAEGPAVSTGNGVQFRDGHTKVFFTDGSLRHIGKVRGKAARKALKRKRQHDRRSRSGS